MIKNLKQLTGIALLAATLGCNKSSEPRSLQSIELKYLHDNLRYKSDDKSDNYWQSPKSISERSGDSEDHATILYNKLRNDVEISLGDTIKYTPK